MKFELNPLNKYALSALLFVCVYHVFSLLLYGSYFICLVFLCAAFISGHALINAQSNTKYILYSQYFFTLIASWLAVFMMFFSVNEQSATLGIWFGILIFCTSILLNTRHALWLNLIALTIYWAFSFFRSGTTFIFIDSALALTIILLISSVIQTVIHDLKTKLNTALETDNLTGCIHPSNFRHELDKVVQLHNRYETPFSLICIKYQNHFSTEHDLQTWLKELTHLYQSRLRKTDILCRFTTQKFMILLPSTTNKSAEALLLDLENCANAYEFSFKNSLTETVDNPTLNFSTERFIKNEDIDNWFKKIQS